VLVTIGILTSGLIALLAAPRGAAAAEIRGAVADERGRPIAGAIVRVQATAVAARTDSQGRFALEHEPAGNRSLLDDPPAPVVLTAWKEGYLNGASEGDEEAVIVLKPVPSGDNDDYRWLSPDFPNLLERADIVFRKGLVAVTGNEQLGSRFTRNCSNCHADSAVAQWRTDAHSRAARNPIVLSMYNGTGADGRRGVFPGYRLDFPNSDGNCASCHAPLHALSSESGGDLNAVTGIARQGISCDFCHKVRDVELHPDGGFPGVLSMKLNRPAEGRQVFYGPYDDAVAGPDSFAAVYAESRFCAACHDGKFWGVSIYSEFEEWAESSYAQEGVQCQDCHMQSDGKATRVAAADNGGVRRSPQDISTHAFRGPADVRFMTEAVELNLSAAKSGDGVDVDVALSNAGAGHHLPTGVPMRNVILVLEAVDANGKALRQVDGPVVPEWGGSGRPQEGNYAGQPGRGFAKILADAAKSFPRANPDRRSPTPHWRQSVVVSDNRIPARATDVSRYRFDHTGPGASEEAVTVRARVIYRRAFKPWIDAKGWPLEDLEIARSEKTIFR
jgi:hypothetical protein